MTIQSGCPLHGTPTSSLQLWGVDCGILYCAYLNPQRLLASPRNNLLVCNPKFGMTPNSVQAHSPKHLVTGKVHHTHKYSGSRSGRGNLTGSACCGRGSSLGLQLCGVGCRTNLMSSSCKTPPPIVSTSIEKESDGVLTASLAWWLVGMLVCQKKH